MELLPSRKWMGEAAIVTKAFLFTDDSASCEEMVEYVKSYCVCEFIFEIAQIII